MQSWKPSTTKATDKAYTHRKNVYFKYLNIPVRQRYDKFIRCMFVGEDATMAIMASLRHIKDFDYFTFK